MINTFKIEGEWKCSSCENWLKGSLSYDPELGAELVLHGTFNSFIFDRSSRELIQGKTVEGEMTLLDSWYNGSTTHNPTGITISKYKPSIILAGHLFTNDKNINFNEVSFKLFNLFNWFSLTGKTVDYNDDQTGYSVKYEKVSEIDFVLNDNSKGKFSFDGRLSNDSKTNKLQIYEEASVSLEYLEAINFKLIIDDIFKFVRLFTLFTYEQSYPISIVFKNNDLKEEVGKVEYLKSINCIYQNSFYNKKHKTRLHYEHLINYENISDDLPKILQNWFNLNSEVEDVIILLTNFFKDKYRFSSTTFMDCVRAFESYHRSYYNNNRIPEEKFNKLINSILEQVNLISDDNEWLKQRLMLNEPNFRKRIKDLLEQNQNKFTKSIPKVSKFCQNATVSRNYYTHYDQRSKSKALDGKELSEITRQLRGVLLSAILTDLGLIDEQFEEGLKYHLD